MNYNFSDVPIETRFEQLDLIAAKVESIESRDADILVPAIVVAVISVVIIILVIRNYNNRFLLLQDKSEESQTTRIS